MNRHDVMLEDFAREMGGAPDIVVRAPGRVNLIGDHTDYNDGFVLPMAIDRCVCVAARCRADRFVHLYSADFDEHDSFNLGETGKLDEIGRVEPGAWWGNYVRGVVAMLQREGYTVNGLDAVITGDVPIGAGLSSSAALELAVVTAFRWLYGLDLDPVGAAVLCQRAENEFVGVRCGIMDQFISSLGRADHALLIDCRELAHSVVPLPAGVRFVVVDSGVRRGLVDSVYNERRAQCEEGARLLGAPSLRDIDLEAFAARKSKLPPMVARRCQHVISENQRVLDSVAALRRGDVVALGAIMNASHASLRDLFEVSTAEVDALMKIERGAPGCLGARLTGAGFGGCTVALVRAEAVDSFSEVVETQYPARGGKTPRVYVCRATDGAGLLQHTV